MLWISQKHHYLCLTKSCWRVTCLNGRIDFYIGMFIFGIIIKCGICLYFEGVFTAGCIYFSVRAVKPELRHQMLLFCSNCVSRMQVRLCSEPFISSGTAGQITSSGAAVLGHFCLLVSFTLRNWQRRTDRLRPQTQPNLALLFWTQHNTTVCHPLFCLCLQHECTGMKRCETSALNELIFLS